MPSNKTFFERIGFLSPLAKILMACGLVGTAAGFTSRIQGILSGGVVLICAGLALVFFREAFRPKLKPQSTGAKEIPQQSWTQWAAIAAVVISAALGIVFKGTLFYVALAMVIASLVVSFIVAIMARRT